MTFYSKFDVGMYSNKVLFALSISNAKKTLVNGNQIFFIISAYKYTYQNFSVNLYIKNCKNMRNSKAPKIAVIILRFEQWFYYRVICSKLADRIANSVEPGYSEGAV